MWMYGSFDGYFGRRILSVELITSLAVGMGGGFVLVPMLLQSLFSTTAFTWVTKPKAVHALGLHPVSQLHGSAGIISSIGVIAVDAY